LKILVADDDLISRRMMNEILRRAGYEVVLVDNGRLAVERLLSQDGPRLALLDWMMPDLDGPEVCQEVRSHRDRPYTYIALLTSKGAKEDLVAGLEAGADDYLTKPCNSEELKARLRTGQRILRLEDTLVDAREEMRFKATHDSLTQLWNRAGILACLDAEIQRAHRENSAFSMLLCDVDHFKQINDTYGHPFGDAVLKEIARRLSRAVRPGDAIGRYGGEEFLVILRDCDEQSIRRRAEHVRHAVASCLFSHSSQQISLSISLGGMAIDGAADRQNPEALLSQIDVAMYQAKMQGRNRTVIVPGHPLTRPHSTHKPDAAPGGAYSMATV
jgi:two-component system, cell cycle response regulator